MADTTKPPTTSEAVGNLAGLAAGIAAIAFPGEAAIIALAKAVLQAAPKLFPSFVALFTTAPMTAEAKAQWAADCEALMNPESEVEASKAKLQAEGLLPKPEGGG